MPPAHGLGSSCRARLPLAPAWRTPAATKPLAGFAGTRRTDGKDFPHERPRQWNHPAQLPERGDGRRRRRRSAGRSPSLRPGTRLHQPARRRRSPRVDLGPIERFTSDRDSPRLRRTTSRIRRSPWSRAASPTSTTPGTRTMTGSRRTPCSSSSRTAAPMSAAPRRRRRRVLVPLPREPVRPAGRPDRRPGRTSARPVPVADPGRGAPVADGTLERPHRGRPGALLPRQVTGSAARRPASLGDRRHPVPGGYVLPGNASCCARRLTGQSATARSPRGRPARWRSIAAALGWCTSHASPDRSRARITSPVASGRLPIPW